MKYTVSLLLAFGMLMAGCNNNTPQNKTMAAGTKDSAASQQDFFPVPDYIGGQLKIIDSLQLPLSMTVTINNAAVATMAKDKDLRFWAQKFQQPDIGNPGLKRQYIETTIADQATPSVTLIYSTANPALPVQKINVYVKPDPVENDKVTGIYIEKTFTVNDTLYNQKLYWKTGKNLQVNTEKKIHGTVLPLEQVKITWNPGA